MSYRAFLGLLLSVLVAAPAHATVFSPSAAFKAGVAASVDVFGQQQTQAECRADCEREFQQCASDRRAGEHTMDCDAIQTACRAACRDTRDPEPRVVRDENFDRDRRIGLTFLAVGCIAILIWAYLGQEDQESY